MFTLEELYATGFNNGYFLAEHTPGLVQKLIPSLTMGDLYVDGLINGSNQYTLEREVEELRVLQNLRTREYDKERERE